MVDGIPSFIIPALTRLPYRLRAELVLPALNEAENLDPGPP